MNHKKIEMLEKIISSDYNNITGIIIRKNGEEVYEKYFNGYTANHATHVYSITKSVFSALLGIAICKGNIKSVGQKVLDFFPDYMVVRGEETIQRITIKDMLTMTAPYKYDTEPYERFFTSENPIQDALDLLGGDKPIGEFNYSAIGGTHILSGILAKATGQSILDFAAENLFLPLKINVPQNIVLHSQEEYMAVMNGKNTLGWVVDPQGFHTASWGLFLTPSDMAKIGQLYLDGGMWQGKQIVPREWIAESTREHSRWNSLSYGYLWWVIDDKEHIYAALGDGGNVIYINTKKKTVISIASLFVPDAKDRIELIREYIEPKLED